MNARRPRTPRKDDVLSLALTRDQWLALREHSSEDEVEVVRLHQQHDALLIA